MWFLIKRYFLHNYLVCTPCNQIKIPHLTNCSNLCENQYTRTKCRADLPNPVVLEKDFTELMMSDTSASVSDPSQCVKQVAPLPEEDVRGQLVNDVVGGCYTTIIEISNSLLRATSTTTSLPLRTAASSRRYGLTECGNNLFVCPIIKSPELM